MMQLASPLSLVVLLLAACGGAEQETEIVQAETVEAAVQEFGIVRPAADGPVTKITSEGPDKTAITIYPDDLALITETRTVNVPAGRSVISFAGVSDRMIPQTALLKEFGAVTLERNFDYALLTPAALYESTVGRQVAITRTNASTGEVVREPATIVSAGEGLIMEIDGRYEAFKCAGTMEKIELTALPENLKAEPTLSIQISAEEAGPQELTISYLASGFDWQADYIVTLKEDGKSAAMTGWLTLENGTAMSFVDAPTSIVAGEVQRLDETYAEEIEPDYLFLNCWSLQTTKTWVEGLFYDAAVPAPAPSPMMARAAMVPEEDMVMAESIIVMGSKIAREENLGDYKLYTTPEPTTVAAYQTKQVAFLAKPDIELEQHYLFDVFEPYDMGDELMAAEIEYRLDNSREGNLAQALPRGTVRVMDRRAEGAAFFLGEDDIDDLAIGLPVKVNTGDATNVRMRMRVLDERYFGRRGEPFARLRVEHVFYNALPEAVSAELTLGMVAPKVTNASHTLVGGEPVPTFRLEVPAEGRVTLTYTVEYPN